MADLPRNYSICSPYHTHIEGEHTPQQPNEKRYRAREEEIEAKWFCGIKCGKW